MAKQTKTAKPTPRRSSIHSGLAFPPRLPISSKGQLAVALAFCLVLGGFVIPGCGSDEVACSSGADCASGVCTATGKCATAEQDATLTFGDGNGAASDSGELTDKDSGGQATIDEDTHAAVDSVQGPDFGTPSVCSPNNDGSVERSEMPIAAGLHATYRIAQNTAVSTAGELQVDGTRIWDLASPLNADHDVLVEAQPIADKWFAASFPGATYAAKLSETAALLGVFEATDTALLLRGVVSPTDGLLRTELKYDPPAVVLMFPVEVGKSFESTSTVTGLTSGVASLYTETYSSVADASGTLATPFADFPVIRVRVELTRIVGILPTVTRSFLFIGECFGTVATIVSGPNELQEEFGFASEVRRLSP